MGSFDWGTGLGAAGGFALGGPLGGLIGGSLFGGGGGNPAHKANKYLDQIPDQLKQYLMPYINAGQGALGNLQGLSGEYQKMYQDPNAIISRLGQGYQQSPGYQFKLNQGQNAINNAAAAGGMAGTGQHQQQAGQLATDLSNQDFNEYMQRVMGIYGGGLQGRTGIESDIYGKGYGASGDLATSLANILKAKAGMSYQGELNKNQQSSDLLSSIGSIFGF